jgi:hypothetical protein
VGRRADTTENEQFFEVMRGRHSSGLAYHAYHYNGNKINEVDILSTVAGRNGRKPNFRWGGGPTRQRTSNFEVMRGRHSSGLTYPRTNMPITIMGVCQISGGAAGRQDREPAILRPCEDAILVV